MTLRFLASLVLALAVSVAHPMAHATAQTCAQGPPTALGTATPLEGACTGGSGGLAGTSCQVLRIDCAGLPSIQVELRITDPPQGVGLLGTVVWGGGGPGVGFYEDRAGGPELFNRLLALGFRVVQRSWRSGWFSDNFGVRKQSCRYATLLQWIHDNVHTSGVFCASGNSGGSSEVAYALSTWGADAILDIALPTGGPPKTRLDYVCQLGPQWPTQCLGLLPVGQMECTMPLCSYSPEWRMCVACQPNPTALDLEEDSIFHPAALRHYPTTRVHQVLGAQDCCPAVPSAFLYSQLMTSENVIEVVPNTPHWVATTPEGRDALVRALLGGIACQGTTATVRAEAWPSVGGPLQFHLNGPGAASYALYYSLQSGLAEFPGLGWAFLSVPVKPMGFGTLDAAGQATVGINVPNNINLVGLDVYIQGRIGTCLSNLVGVRVLP